MMLATGPADKALKLWRDQLRPRGFDPQRVLTRGPGYLTFEARVVSGGESVALKIFPGYADRERRQRFQQALERRASLQHPNLLRVHSFGEAVGYPFLALEMSEAPSLSTRLRNGDLGLEECMSVLRGIARAVDAAARRGVVAREITPDAILVDPVRGGLIGDLGVAPEAVGPVPAMPDSQLPYCPPEELHRDPVDSSAGVYSIGAVLFTALTGARPFEVGYPRATLPVFFQPPTVRRWRPDLPRAIDRVVARAMARNPDARYRTARGLIQAGTMALSTAGRVSRPQPAHT